MPRTLPWQQGNTYSAPPTPQHDGERDRQGRQTTRKSTPTHPSKKRRRPSRTPSTSPPPAPPEVDFMQPGDDDWMMVEDEFLSTAQAFTRHLHFAEYQRLKRLAAQKNQDSLQAIQRPVQIDTIAKDFSLTALKAARNTNAIESNTKHVLRSIGAREQIRENSDDSDTDDSDIVHDRNLAGLMRGDEVRKSHFELSFSTKDGLSPTSRDGPGCKSGAQPRKLPVILGGSPKQEILGASSKYSKQHTIRSDFHVSDGNAPQIAQHSSSWQSESTRVVGGRKLDTPCSMLTEPRKSTRPQHRPTVGEEGSCLREWRKARESKKKQENQKQDDEVPIFL